MYFLPNEAPILCQANTAPNTTITASSMIRIGLIIALGLAVSMVLT